MDAERLPGSVLGLKEALSLPLLTRAMIETPESVVVNTGFCGGVGT
jgi:hypothetical protein